MSSKATEIAKNLPTLEHPDGSPIRALVADDEEMLKELVSMGLKMIGWEVQSATDGPTALAIARDWRPDVLVLDIMMPGFDGLELLERIRKFYPEVPCLFLTAKDSVDNRIEGLAAGADDYVTKPFSMEEVMIRLHRLVQRSGVAAVDDAELVVGDLILNQDTREVSRGGDPIPQLSSICCATSWRTLNAWSLKARFLITCGTTILADKQILWSFTSRICVRRLMWGVSL